MPHRNFRNICKCPFNQIIDDFFLKKKTQIIDATMSLNQNIAIFSRKNGKKIDLPRREEQLQINISSLFIAHCKVP